jgi:hypothetical protein
MATLDIEKKRKVAAKATKKETAAKGKVPKGSNSGQPIIEYMPGGVLTVSQSKVKSFRKCHRQHYNKYVLGLRRKIKSRPLMFGSIIHRMLEADANGDDPFEMLDKISENNTKLFRVEREMYGAIVDDIRVIMTDYFKYWEGNKKNVIFLRRAKKSAEHLFELELGDGLRFKGKADAVVKSQGMKWLMEDKTFKRMPDEDTRWKSVQSATYIKAIEILGWWTGIEGTLWNYIGNKEPAVPALLQSGKISEAKLNSLPSRVEAFIKSQGAKAKDYPKLMSYVKDNQSSWFLRIYTPLNQAVVDNTWEDFLETAREMQRMGEKSKARTVDQHCGWCDYKALCAAEIAGLDVDFLIEREYTYEPEESLDGEEEPE